MSSEDPPRDGSEAEQTLPDVQSAFPRSWVYGARGRSLGLLLDPGRKIGYVRVTQFNANTVPERATPWNGSRKWI